MIFLHISDAVLRLTLTDINPAIVRGFLLPIGNVYGICKTNIYITSTYSMHGDIHNGMKQILYWERPEDGRFYEVYVGRDLFGDRLFIRRWGSLKSARHGEKIAVLTRDDIKRLPSMISEIIRKRAHRHYRLIHSAISSDLF